MTVRVRVRAFRFFDHPRMPFWIITAILSACAAWTAYMGASLGEYLAAGKFIFLFAAIWAGCWYFMVKDGTVSRLYRWLFED